LPAGFDLIAHVLPPDDEDGLLLGVVGVVLGVVVGVVLGVVVGVVVGVVAELDGVVGGGPAGPVSARSSAW
jgi:hypothetical protein